MAQITHAHFATFHFCRCYFICDLIVGSICLLISGYILVKVGSTDPSMPSSLIKRREEKVGVSLWVTIYVNMNKENHWFVPQVWEESGLMYLALLLRTPSTAGDRNSTKLATALWKDSMTCESPGHGISGIDGLEIQTPCEVSVFLFTSQFCLPVF